MKINITNISRIAGLVVVIAAAGGVLYTWSPWAWTWEFKEIAAISCRTAINQQFDLIIILENRLSEARQRGDTQRVIELTQQLARLKGGLEETKNTCNT